MLSTVWVNRLLPEIKIKVWLVISLPGPFKQWGIGIVRNATVARRSGDPDAMTEAEWNRHVTEREPFSEESCPDCGVIPDDFCNGQDPASRLP